MLKNYLKIACRNLWHQKLYSLINIGGLSVAMTAAVFILMWVQNELRFDNYHPDAGRIYLVKNYLHVHENTQILENSPYPLHKAIEHELPEAELVTYARKTRENELTLQVNGAAFSEGGIYVDENWFEVFHYDFIEGSPQAFFSYPYSLILTESKARKFFGNTAVAGRTMQIDSTEYMVQAVVEDNPVNSSFQFDLLMPHAAYLDNEAIRAVNHWMNQSFIYNTFVRLQAGADAAKTEDKITAMFRRNREDQGSHRAALLPLKSLRFDRDFQSSAFKHVSIQTVQVFSALAVLLLLTAGINYVNLSLARAGSRSKEISIRKVTGAARRQLFFQLMTESALTGLLALLITLLLVRVCLPFFNAFTGMNFTFNPLEPHLALLLSGMLFSVVLLTGTYPGLVLSAFNPIGLLRGLSMLKVKHTVLRKGLVTGQFALAVIMTVAAITVYKQLLFIQQQETGYNRSQVFTMQVPDEAFGPVKKYFQAEEQEREGKKPPDILLPVKQKLLAQSQVKHVVRTNTSVVNLPWTISGNLDWEGKDPDYHPQNTPLTADADLNKIVNFQFVAGRWFDKNRPADLENVVLNETAVREFGLEEPVVGKRFNDGKIIGVVKDFYYKSMHEKIGPVVIRTELPPYAATLMVETQPGKPADALRAAETVWNKHFPGQPFNYNFLDDEFDRLYRDDQKARSFTMVFSGLSILISCLGLLGLVSFAAEQRTKEIGIRKVLGASVVSVVTLLSKDFIKLVGIAILLATPIAWYVMNRWLEDFAYRIGLQWWTFALAGLLAVLIALLTVSFQSVKAALVNPVRSLRSE